MPRSLQAIAGLVLLAVAAFTGSVQAEIPNRTLRVGVLNDANGPFADQSGRGGLIAAQMAAEDFAREATDPRVEIVYGDHQNKPDVGSGIVRTWVERDGVSAVADSVNSGVGLAVNRILADRDLTFVASNVGTSDLSGPACQPTTVQWSMDTWAFGNAAARAMADQGGNSWFFISFDYALGQALERDATNALKKLGGTVSGSVRHPLGTADFSSYLLQAQSSGSKVIALGDTGVDLINAVRQAREFGLSQKLVGLFTQAIDVQAIGLADAQGLIATESFYWDLNDATRAFSRRFAARHMGRVPTANQAAVYSSVLAYLRTAKAADSIRGAEVIARMRAAPIEDSLFGTVIVRPDGRAIHPMYVFQVKTPAESRAKEDVYKLLRVIPTEEAFRPLAEGGCKLVK